MSRLNIEDSLFTDDRFISLCVALKSEIKAIGWWVKVARLAQSYWKNDRGLIPKNVYIFNKIPSCFIATGMVEEREDGYYLHGSEENFAWILANVRNGLKGGRPRKDIEIIEKPITQQESHGKATENLPSPSPTQKEKNTKKSSATASPMPSCANDFSDSQGQDLFDSKPQENSAKKNNQAIAKIRQDAIAYLNKKTGRNFNPESANAKKIDSRIREFQKAKIAISLDSFKQVIDTKCAEWIGTDFEKFLRPETLFGPKFDGYLNAPGSDAKGSIADKVFDMLNSVGGQDAEENHGF